MLLSTSPRFPKLTFNTFKSSKPSNGNRTHSKGQNLTNIQAQKHHTKSFSVFDFPKASRNRTSSIKENVSESTTHASKNSKLKTLTLSTSIKPFSFADPQKEKKEFSPPPFVNKEEEMIRLNDLFRMKNYETNLFKYNMTKRNEEKKKQKKKIGKIVYMEMKNKFYDDKVEAKTSRDKTIESESIEMKKIIRFWKGIFDITYPNIVVDKMKYSCMQSKENKNLIKFSNDQGNIGIKVNKKPQLNKSLLKSKLKLHLKEKSFFKIKKV